MQDSAAGVAYRWCHVTMTNILWQFYSETTLPVDVMSWLFIDINIYISQLKTPCTFIGHIPMLLLIWPVFASVFIELISQGFEFKCL